MDDQNVFIRVHLKFQCARRYCRIVWISTVILCALREHIGDFKASAGIRAVVRCARCFRRCRIGDDRVARFIHNVDRQRCRLAALVFRFLARQFELDFRQIFQILRVLPLLLRVDIYLVDVSVRDHEFSVLIRAVCCPEASRNIELLDLISIVVIAVPFQQALDGLTLCPLLCGNRKGSDLDIPLLQCDLLDFTAQGVGSHDLEFDGIVVRRDRRIFRFPCLSDRDRPHILNDLVVEGVAVQIRQYIFTE